MAGVAVAAATQVAAAEEEEEEEEKKVRDSRRRVRLPLRTTLPRFFPSLFSFFIQLCSLSLSRASRQPWSPKRTNKREGKIALSLPLPLSLSPSGEFDGRRKNAGRRRRGRKRKEETRQLANPGNEGRGGARGGRRRRRRFRFRGFVVGDFGYKGETFDPKAENCPKIRDISYQLTERERAR